MFLNSTKEGELKERLPEVKTRVLPPPTDLDAFLKVDVDYGHGLRLVRHNSQRDAKHPEYTNDLIAQILDEVGEDTQFYYMPAYSKTFDHPNVHKFKVNEVPVPRFLSDLVIASGIIFHRDIKIKVQGLLLKLWLVDCLVSVIIVMVQRIVLHQRQDGYVMM
jgi:hypothetical protein